MNAVSPMPRALLVDDEPTIVELLRITLEGMGLAVEGSHSLQEAYSALDAGPPTLCLTDLRLPDGSGIELVRRLHNLYPQVPVAVITAYSSTEGAIEAMQAGAFDFMTKPIELGRLRRLVEQAMAAASLPSDPDPLVNRLVGTSAVMQHLRQEIRLLGRSNAPVFIWGESGTGKELAARAIHDAGPRRKGPFVAVNCGAIPEGLLESELFGAEKGAFSGATQKRGGLFLTANGGTLFLDEIGELPLSMQVKILRAIQERAIRPLGSAQEIPVDIRLVTATHRDLQQMVAEGSFREDLYYRIHVVPLHIPPLRDRREDIPVLTHALLQKLAQRQGQPSCAVSSSAMLWLGQQHFAGNVRELENLLERALALHHGNEIDIADLQQPGSQAAVTQREMPAKSARSPLAARLGQAEALFLQEQLAAHGGDFGRCAEALGIPALSLRVRMTLQEETLHGTI